MADIFLHFRNKFNRNPELIATEPTVQQSLELTEQEITDYEQWKNCNAHIAMINWLRDQLMAYSSTYGDTHDGIDFFVSSTSKGFRLHPALTRFSDTSIRHLFNYIKEQLERLDYRITLSDTRVFGRGYWNEMIHRHIAKPCTEGGIEFAQVTVEMMLKDDKLVSLKIDASIPNTDMPRTTDDFSDLMQAILA
jgi:hypothetical protein